MTSNQSISPMLIIVRVGLGLTRGRSANSTTYRSTTDNSSWAVHDSSLRDRPGHWQAAAGKGVRTLDAFDAEEGRYRLDNLRDGAPSKAVIVTKSTISDVD